MTTFESEKDRRRRQEELAVQYATSQIEARRNMADELTLKVNLQRYGFERLRRIVKLAAQQAEKASPFLYHWLLHDPYGTWAKKAADALEHAFSHPKFKTMTEEEVDKECATFLVFLGAKTLMHEDIP